ncbi:MAG: hypothetical protein ACKVQQ_24795 [Burkholderiales bacterium]
MTTARRRSSRNVTLVLIGAAAAMSLAGCGESPMQRDLYASRADCEADWGPRPDACEPSPVSGTTRSGRTGTWYHGPQYSANETSRGAASQRAVGTTSVTRSGFGSTGHASSSSGG